MKIYLKPPQPSRGLQRIADALVRYKPEWVEVVDKFAEADLVILYAIGRRERMEALTTALREDGLQKYAIIQVCLRSTMSPHTKDWREIWHGAEVVWSYYDLNQACADDGAACGIDNFYHSPLGADATMFRDMKMPKQYTVATSGLSRLSESVRECEIATAEVSGRMFHLGPEVTKAPHVTCKTGLADLQLAVHYSACEFVSALRRKEGFELPAVEGLLCGARPICFKGADWEWNYGHHAIYIEETDRQGVTDQLVQLFRHGAPPVTPEERELAVTRYDWKTIVSGFYERLKP